MKKDKTTSIWRRLWFGLLIASALITATSQMGSAGTSRPFRYYTDTGFTAFTYYTNASGDGNNSLWGINTDNPRCELDINGTICINRTGYYYNGVNISSGGGGGAPSTAQYVTMALDGGLSNERVLTPGKGITLIDTGAGGIAQINLTADTCTVGNYSRFNGSGLECNPDTGGSGSAFDPSGLYNNITAVNDSLNLTIRRPIMQGAVTPDTSGNVWFEPASITQTNDLYPQTIVRFKDTATNDTLGFQFMVPSDYKANTIPHIIITWTTTATTGNVTWGLKYNSASQTSTLDPVSSEENLTLTNTVAGTSQTGVTSTFNLTAANLAANDIMQMALLRDGNTTTDNTAADIIAYDVELEYNNR